ncbi:MAG TPA: hypothetical protein VMG37_04010, partial [Solirubrobacteraceae bacterium]|nr:hypothetical protein [Solirubrobacteraceae bacterium]
MITWIRASMPESRETVFRPASGGGLRMVIDASKLDSFVQLAITKRSYPGVRDFARNRWPLRGRMADAPG